MKRYVVLIPLLFLFYLVGAVNGYVRHCGFYSPTSGTYIESYITVPINSLKMESTASDGYQAGVEVTLLYKQGEKIIKFDKYLLTSKTYNSKEVDESLLDVKRVALPAGNYTVETSFKDAHDKKGKKVEVQQKLVVNDFSEKLSISDVQLIESYEQTEDNNTFTKNGYLMLPHSINYFPNGMDRLKYYFEVYNSNTIEDDVYLISQSINYYNSTKVYKNIKSFSKKKGSELEAVLAEFDISQLPSGNYDLTVQVINKQNKVLIEKKQFIQRLNLNYVENENDLLALSTDNTFAYQLSDEDALYQIKTLYPISTRSEVDLAATIGKEKNGPLAKQFLLNFFTKRNGANPGEPYEKYMQAVTAVNKEYDSQLEQGYETEIGRVYLQYGAPNSIIKDQMRRGLDYQLWHYYQLPGGQRNVTFLFFRSGLIDDQSGGAFRIFHSDATNEQQFSSWQAAKQALVDDFGGEFDDAGLDKLFQYMGDTGRIRDGGGSTNQGVNPFE